jgi:hypothetical protein
VVAWWRIPWCQANLRIEAHLKSLCEGRLGSHVNLTLPVDSRLWWFPGLQNTRSGNSFEVP